MAKIFYSTTHQRTAQPRSKRLRQLGTAASGASAGTAADGRITALQSLIDGNTTAINANTTAIAGNTAAIATNKTAIAENKTAIATNKSSIDDIKATLADWFTLEGTVLHTRYALASDDTVSSLGVGADGGGTGSGSGYGRLDSWDNYAPAAGDVLSATLGYDLLQRIENIQFPEVDLGGYYTAVKTDSLLAGKQDVISDLATIRSGAALGATALQSFTESDPVFKASAAATITPALISYWNTAYGWGNHAAKGYLVASALDGYATEQWVTDKGYALQTALDETDQFLKELVEEFNTLNGTVSGHTTQIATINSALATHGNQITALGQLTTNHTTAIKNNTEDIETNTAAIAENKTAIATNKSSIDDIKATLADWFTLEGTVLHTRYALASDDTVSSLGVGTDSGGTGTGSANWGAVPTDIVPSTGGAYTLGTSDAPWKMVYANYGTLGSLVSTPSGVTLTSYLMGAGNTWQIASNGEASFESLSVGGVSFANKVDKSAIVKTVISGTDEADYYRISLYNSVANAYTYADIPSYARKGFESIESVGGVFLADDAMVYDILDYVDAKVAEAGSNVDLSNYYTKAQVHSYVAQEINTFNENLATVATSGKYSDLSGKPTLGTAAAKGVATSVTSGSSSLVTSGAVYTALSDYAKQTSLDETDQLLSELVTDFNTLNDTVGGLATVATSGKYSDLSDIPTLGTAASKNWTGTHAGDTGNLVTTTWVEAKLAGYATTAVASTSANGLMSAAMVTKLNGIATGATAVTSSTVSGWGYTKNAGTVTSVAVKMNGSTKGTVTSSGTIDLGTVLTAHQSLADYAKQTSLDETNQLLSELVTDFNTLNDTVGGLATVATSGKYSDLSGIPTLGTAASKNWTGTHAGDTGSLVTTTWVEAKLAALNYLTSGSQTTTSSADGGSNVFTFTKSDGTTATFTIKNGSKGSTGATGPQGPQGPQGATGATGAAGRSVGSVVCVTANNGTTTGSASTADNGTTYYRVKDTSGNWLTGTIAVKNGSKGSTGATGLQGPQGPAGVNATTTAVATTSANGLMSAAMVTKLNGIATGATAVTSSTVSGWGYTKNAGTVTSVAVKMNGSTKGTVTSSGTIDLGTVLTAHQSLAGYAKLSAQNTFTAHNSFNSGISVNGLLNANGGLDVYGFVRGFMSDTDSDTWSIDGDTGAASFAKVTTSGSINSKSTTSGQTVQIGHTSTTSVLQCIANATGQTGKTFLIQNSTGSGSLIRTTGAGDGSGIGGDMTLSCGDTVNNEITGLWLCNKAVAPTKIAVLGPCLGTSMRTALDEYGSGVDIAGGLLAISSKETSYQNIHSAILDWDKSASTLYFKKFYKNDSGTWTTGAMNVDVSGNLSANSLDVTGDITCNGNGFRELWITVSDLSGYYNDLGALAHKDSLTASDIPSLSWSKITSGKPTTLAGYGITDALKVTVPDATFPKEVELDYDNVNFKYALSVTSIYFNDGFALSTTNNGNDLYYDGSVILSDYNYSNYALSLTGGTINGWLDVDGDFTVTGNIHSYKQLTAEGGAEFVGRIGGLDSLGGNTVWEITSGGNAYLNGLHINPNDEASTYGGMISFGDEWGGMPYIAEESDDAITIHAMNGLYISHDVYAVQKGDDWSTYWSIVGGYASFKGLSVMNRDDNEISFLGDTTSWIGTDLTAHGDLGVGGDLSVEGLAALNGNIRMTSATSPTIAFRYGNAASTTSQIQGGADNSVRLVYNVEVFTSSTNYKNHIQLNYNNTRIFRLNNSSSGMQYQYGTSDSNVTTKGTFSTSGAYAASSDLTKKNILSYGAGFGVDEIAGAPIAYFTWKDLDDSRVNLGSIAQYWQHIAPECIYGTEGIDLTMDYSTLGLVSSIINARAIVRHESEIDTLKRRVKELEDKLAAYEAA